MSAKARPYLQAAYNGHGQEAVKRKYQRGQTMHLVKLKFTGSMPPVL